MVMKSQKMKDNLKDPFLYDHIFRPRRLPLVLMTAIFGFILVVFSIFGAYRELFFDWRAKVFLGTFVLFFIVGCLVSWLYPKMLSVGVNDDGIYVRNQGMVFWDEIKKFSVKNISTGKDSSQTFIFIELISPEAFFVRHKRCWVHKKMFGNAITIAESGLPMKAKEFMIVLEDLRDDYRKKK